MGGRQKGSFPETVVLQSARNALILPRWLTLEESLPKFFDLRNLKLLPSKKGL